MSTVGSSSIMHRSYSMRNHRLPTAAELESPLPPPSTTKSSRIWSASLGHAFRKTTAGAFSPSLSKKLSQLVKMEKNVMRSMEQVSRERMEVARQISEWGEAGDEDVSDVTDKIGVLLYEIAELEDQMVDRYDQYRLTLKSIRNIEKSVQPSRERKQKITDEIAKLKYKEPNSPRLPILEQELVRAEAEALVADAQLSNITREKLKIAFAYHFDSLREHGEKQAMIATYGKHLLDLVDDQPVTPGETRNAYDGYEASKAIIQDCENALTNWVPSAAAVKPALSIRTRTLSQARRHRTSAGSGASAAGSLAGTGVGSETRRTRSRETHDHPIPEEESGSDMPRYRLEDRPMSMHSSSEASSISSSARQARGHGHGHGRRSVTGSARARRLQEQHDDFRREQELEDSYAEPALPSRPGTAAALAATAAHAGDHEHQSAAGGAAGRGDNHQQRHRVSGDYNRHHQQQPHPRREELEFDSASDSDEFESEEEEDIDAASARHHHPHHPHNHHHHHHAPLPDTATATPAKGAPAEESMIATSAPPVPAA